jgi:hypothetical protein
VGIETRVATLCDSFSEEFHSICGIAEYNGLINLKLISKEGNRKQTLENREFKHGSLSFSSTKA